MTAVYIIAALTICTVMLTFVTVALRESERAQLMLGMMTGTPTALYLTWILLETSAVLAILILTSVVAGALIFVGERGRPAIKVPSTMYPLVLVAIAGMLTFGGVLCIAGNFYPKTVGAPLLVSGCAVAAASLAGLEVPARQPGFELMRRALLAAAWIAFAAVFVLLGMWTLAAMAMMTGGMVVVVAVRPLRTRRDM